MTSYHTSGADAADWGPDSAAWEAWFRTVRQGPVLRFC